MLSMPREIPDDVDPTEFFDFWQGYLEGLGFTATIDDESGSGDPIWGGSGEWTNSHSAEDVLASIPPDSIQELWDDCLGFIREACGLIRNDTMNGGDFQQAGTDFHFTRNSHGAGFWDGDWQNGDKLTQLSEPYGSAELMRFGENGEFYVCY